jgi:periplasmic protein TonB
MENNLKVALFVSIAIHLSIFTIAAVKLSPVVYLSVPVEFLYTSMPAPAAANSEIQLPKEKEKEEVPLPKTKKKTKTAKKKEAEKPKEKEAAKETGASQRQLIPSGQITLDSARFPYTYYTGMIVNKINRNWQWSVDFGQLKATLYFQIQKDGAVIDAKIKKSSGDDLFDQQALRAIKLSSPFPPLPIGYDEDKLGVYFEFSFRD